MTQAAKDLFHAVGAGNLEKVMVLITQNPTLMTSVNNDGIGPISVAVYNFHRTLADAMVAIGAQPTFFEACALGYSGLITEHLKGDATLVNAFAPDGLTPLTLAAAFGGLEPVQMLLAQGADTELRAKHTAIQVAPLHAAVFGNRTDVAGALLAAGANPNSVQPGGFTALHGAAQNGNAELVALLLNSGADPNALTDGGKSAIALAQEAGHQDVVKLLNESASPA